MEWIGWISLILLLCYCSYPGKVKRLESKVKRLERKERGETEMSGMIKNLAGESCIIRSGEIMVPFGGQELVCDVLEADDEWIKFAYTDKKKQRKTKIIRVDAIDSIELKEK